MTRNQAHIALKMLNALMDYIRRHGGNKDTLILDGLRKVKDLLIDVYGDDV